MGWTEVGPIETRGEIITDPVFEYNRNGKPYYRFAFKDNKAIIYTCKCWNQMAERLMNRFHEGELVWIKGKHQINSWEGAGTDNDEIIIWDMKLVAIEGTDVSDLLALCNSSFSQLQERLDKGLEMINNDPQNEQSREWRILWTNIYDTQKRIIYCAKLLQRDCRILQTNDPLIVKLVSDGLENIHESGDSENEY